jgi:predicted butyrate kinase (DUF1464 family)
MVRVAGTDPGTSSLDVVILEDGVVVDQVRFTPAQLQADAATPTRWLQDRGPFALIAGPSGYGLPLKRSAECVDSDLALMALVRPDERGQGQGVAKFLAVARSLANSGLPVVFLPGVIHLRTVPPHRKINRIDLGTADKLCVTALALTQHPAPEEATFCLVELGSAFSACIVVSDGRIVDGAGGTSGPVGFRAPVPGTGKSPTWFRRWRSATCSRAAACRSLTGTLRVPCCASRCVAALPRCVPSRRSSR